MGTKNEETAARFKGAGTPFLEESKLIQRFTKWLLKHLQEPCNLLGDAIGARSRIEYLNQTADSPHMMTQSSLAALAMPARIEMVAKGEIKMRWGATRGFAH